MKKLFSVVLCLCLCMVMLSSCEANNKVRTTDYDEGYYAGYEDGLWDGAYECKKDFATAVSDRYSDVEHATKNGRYFHPEDAIIVLNDYLDGEYVSDNELKNAIETITDFYYDWNSVIANIGDLDVDIYFGDRYIPLD